MGCICEVIGLLCRRTVPRTFYVKENQILKRGPQLPQSDSAVTINCSGTVIALLILCERCQVRYVMVYEVLISTTIAMVLLPFNFWIAAELVVFIGTLTMAWELRLAKA